MPTPKAQVIKLSEKEQQELEKLVSKHQTGQQMALRARIILAGSSGQTNTAIAQKYAVKHDTVKMWRNRWVKLQDLSLDDLSVEQRLSDAPRPGAPRRITTDQRCKIEALACEKPEKAGRPISQWTAREIADEVMERKIVAKISGRHAARLLKIR
jgi:putative transposase